MGNVAQGIVEYRALQEAKETVEDRVFNQESAGYGEMQKLLVDATNKPEPINPNYALHQKVLEEINGPDPKRDPRERSPIPQPF